MSMKGVRLRAVRSGSIVVIGVLLLVSCGGLGALSGNPMARPVLSFVEPVEVVELEGDRRGRSQLSPPARLTTFFEFEADQRDLAVRELLEQAADAGFDLENQLTALDWPLARYRATDSEGIVLTITVSAQNIGVELT